MNSEQIMEIVKNINLAFDGKLNSETLVEVAREVMPYFWMLQIKSLIVHVLWAIAVTISAWLVGRAILKTGSSQ